MKWQGKQGSSNVEDRRGGGGRRRPAGGGKKMGLFGVIIFMVLGYVFRDSPIAQQFLGAAQQQMSTETTVVNTPREGRADDELAKFVSVVLKETEDCWTQIFRNKYNTSYQKPVLVIYDGKVNSACGSATSATGPFYCPGDQKLYIDLSFYDELHNKFGVKKGDFAMAYVVAHEVAHHVQYLRGITRQVDAQRGKISQEAYNDLSVRLELQADFLSGVWTKYIKDTGSLEAGDIEEALSCANAIGDDHLQMQARGYVVPESFTHGSSKQRMRWFTKGLNTGDIDQGNTFSTREL